MTLSASVKAHIASSGSRDFAGTTRDTEIEEIYDRLLGARRLQSKFPDGAKHEESVSYSMPLEQGSRF